MAPTRRSLTALVLFVGVVGLVGDIPGRHKAAIFGIVVVTILTRLTFLMLF